MTYTLVTEFPQTLELNTDKDITLNSPVRDLEATFRCGAKDGPHDKRQDRASTRQTRRALVFKLRYTEYPVSWYPETWYPGNTTLYRSRKRTPHTIPGHSTAVV